MEKEELILNMLKAKSSIHTLKAAFKELKPRKKNEAIWCIIATVISIFLGVMLYLRRDTIETYGKIVSDINNVIIALFGIVFTGYTLFQAFASPKFVEIMLKDAGKNKSSLQETNEYFVSVMMLYIVDILANVVIIICITVIPLAEIGVWIAPLIKGGIVTVVTSVYFVYNYCIIRELISFVFNLFQLFNIHAAATYCDENDIEI